MNYFASILRYDVFAQNISMQKYNGINIREEMYLARSRYVPHSYKWPCYLAPSALAISISTVELRANKGTIMNMFIVSKAVVKA